MTETKVLTAERLAEIRNRAARVAVRPGVETTAEVLAACDVPALLAALEAARAELDLLRSDHAQLEGQRDALERELGETRAYGAKVEGERDGARAKLDGLLGRVVDLFDAGFNTRGEKAMTAADALRELVGLQAGGAAWKMGAGHPEVRAREEAERKLAEARESLDRRDQRLAEARARVAELERSLESSRRDYERILESRDKAEQDSDGYAARVAELEGALAQARSQIPTWAGEERQQQAERIKELERALATARAKALEEAERIAEADLLDQPGVLVAAERRADGGASERAARRIAEKLFRIRSNLLLGAAPPEQAPALHAMEGARDDTLEEVARELDATHGRTLDEDAAALCAAWAERVRDMERRAPAPPRTDDATPPADALLRVAHGFLRVWDEKNGDGNTLAPEIPEAVAALRRVVERTADPAPRTDAWAQPSVHGLVDALLDIRGWSAPRAPPNWATTPIPCEELRARIYERTWAALPGEPSVLCSVAPQTADVGADWTVTNRRRGQLIERQEAGTITPAEAEELARLQRVADEKLASLAPWRFDDVDATVERLRAEGRWPADGGAAPPASTGTAPDLARFGDAAIEEARKLAQAGDPLCAREGCGHPLSEHDPDHGCLRPDEVGSSMWCPCPGFVAPGAGESEVAP